MTTRIFARLAVLILTASLTGLGCDLEAGAGQTVMAGDGGSVFGSGGNAQRAPLPAVRLRPGGTLVVEDAKLSGGGIVVERIDQPRYGVAGPAVLSAGGTVRFRKGMLSGGPILLQVPRMGADIDAPAPAIDARFSQIEISGGSIAGGGVFSSLPGSVVDGPPGSALRATRSVIRVTDGVFSLGALNPQNPAPTPSDAVFKAMRSNTEIRGGEFRQDLEFTDGITRIFGGRGGRLTFSNAFDESCSELHGGRFESVSISGGRLIVFGTQLSLSPLLPPTSSLTGTLEDGTVAPATVSTNANARVELVPPGSPGCPPPSALTARFSFGIQGQEAERGSGAPDLSANGRFLAFTAQSPGAVDVFLRDTVLDTIETISRREDGGAVLAISSTPSISGDGRFVAFVSTAENLVDGTSGPVPNSLDVFLKDRLTGRVELVSRGRSGGPGNGNSSVPVLSADGKFVAFCSRASDLVPDDTNGRQDFFVFDTTTREIERVNVSGSGAQDDVASPFTCLKPGISADGRFVAFDSTAPNLVAGDTNGVNDIFVRDRLLERTERVSIGSAGQEGRSVSVSPSISADGRFVVFASDATEFAADQNSFGTDIFLRDRALGTTERISTGFDGRDGNNRSFSPVVSADGRFIAYLSSASNLVRGVSGSSLLFLFDRERRETTLESPGIGTSGIGSSGTPGITPSGDLLVFSSFASNLVPDDTNGVEDVFLRTRIPDAGDQPPSAP